MAEPEIADRIEMADIDALIPYSNNPKEHPEGQIKKIASSIKNYGWDVPIVVDGDNEIIKGHGRHQAAQQLGLEEVPVIRRDDLTEAEAKAARIADNKTAESEWDTELLETELGMLVDMPDITDASLGFSGKELDEILEEKEETEEVKDPEVHFATELLEKNNYVVFQFSNKMDWQVVQDELGLQTVKSHDSEGDYQQRGVGRVLDGQELLDRL